MTFTVFLSFDEDGRMAPNQEEERSGSKPRVLEPHFFKVILLPFDQGLKIPRAFMSEYGWGLQDIVTLKVPTGASWQVELVHYGDGSRLRKGWLEFAEYCSIKKFFFLVFTYEGNSQFLVSIFDATTLEIEYPAETDCERSGSPIPTSFDEFLMNHPHINVSDDNAEEKILENYPTTGASQRVRGEDVSTQMLDDLSPRQQNPLPRPGPRTRSSHRLMTEDPLSKRKNAVVVDTNPNEHPRSNGNNNWKKNPEESSMGTRRSLPSPFSISNHAVESAKEESKAYQKAKAFRSSHPFFIYFVQSSCVSGSFFVCIPSNFEEDYLTKMKDCKFMLHVSGKLRKWPAILRVSSTERAKIGQGWRKFAKDNCLKLGDVCVFELVRPARKFNVTVYPAAETGS